MATPRDPRPEFFVATDRTVLRWDGAVPTLEVVLYAGGRNFAGQCRLSFTGLTGAELDRLLMDDAERAGGFPSLRRRVLEDLAHALGGEVAWGEVPPAQTA